jgi:hypothetical protein
MYMGSSIWYDECPQCKNNAYFAQDNRLFEFLVMCPLCGYFFRQIAIIDRKSHPLDFKRTKDRKIIFRKVEQKGFGVRWISRKDGSCAFYCHKKSITSSCTYQFIKLLATPDIIPEKSYQTCWDDETKTVIAVVGKVYHPCDKEPLDKDKSTPMDNTESFADELPIPF